MGASLCISNLSLEATERDVEQLFSRIGRVMMVKLIVLRDWGSRRVVGLVQMVDSAAADQAVAALDGETFFGCTLKVWRGPTRRLSRTTATASPVLH